MKVIYFTWWIGIFFAAVIVFIHIFVGNKIVQLKSPLPKIIISKDESPLKQETALFVPYWTLSDAAIDGNNYTRLIYFSIVPDTNGIDITSDGYKKIPVFLSRVDAKKTKLLTVQMINTDINTVVLKNTDIQNQIIQQSIATAKKFSFDGIVIDFEYSALPFASITDPITAFITKFNSQVHSDNLKFYMTVYGDQFYRARPFNIPALAKQVDGMYIMAYDFHKANGDPGANFPLSAGKNDDYDFMAMTRDFLHDVPAEKLTVIFGLFGYDWKVNANGQSISRAKSISVNEIKGKFFPHCPYVQCSVVRDSVSQEMEITYTDTTDSTNHALWFEDLQSIARKKEVLRSMHISSTALWAYSYF